MASVTRNRSKELFDRAVRSIPGGVNSPVRAFRAVGTNPVFIQSAQGSRLKDADGNEYIDFVSAYGPLILGHAHEEVVKAVAEAARQGTSFGAPTEGEIELAETIVSALPGVEKVRLVNSGTEATMSALRLARGATGRNMVVKFAGCYHGHVDSLLIQAGSGAATFGTPSSPGVPKESAQQTIALSYNDLDQVEAAFEQYGQDIAAVIVEPVAGNMGVVPPKEGFLEGLRAITRRYGALLIFDEVMTGFRVAYGGAQVRYDITPDLTCLGKIIGGGLPVGAFGGSSELMDQLAPAGPVYQAGTLSGNPLSVAAGRATLNVLEKEKDSLYADLEEKTAWLNSRVAEAAQKAGVPFSTTQVGSMSGWFFTDSRPTDYDTVVSSDTDAFAVFFRSMLRRGVYLAPSQFEAVFLSAAHTEADLQATVEAAKEAFEETAAYKEAQAQR